MIQLEAPKGDRPFMPRAAVAHAEKVARWASKLNKPRGSARTLVTPALILLVMALLAAALTSLGDRYTFANSFVFSLPLSGGMGMQVSLLVAGLAACAAGLLLARASGRFGLR